MENFVLGLVLFFVTFSFLCSLYCEYCRQNGIEFNENKESNQENETSFYPEDTIKYLDELEDEIAREDIIKNSENNSFDEKDVDVIEQVNIDLNTLEINDNNHSEIIKEEIVREEKVDNISNDDEKINELEDKILSNLPSLTVKILRKLAQELNISIRHNGKVKTKSTLIEDMRKELLNHSNRKKFTQIVANYL